MTKKKNFHLRSDPLLPGHMPCYENRTFLRATDMPDILR
jgi:hypothetical protein